MKWEKWDQMDYTRRNLVGPSPLHEQHLQEVGIPLRFAPEAPKLKKTWVKKEGHGRFFQKTQECESAKMGAMQRVHVYYALATIMDRSTDTYCMCDSKYMKMACTTFVSVRGADTIFDAAYVGNMLCTRMLVHASVRQRPITIRPFWSSHPPRLSLQSPL